MTPPTIRTYHGLSRDPLGQWYDVTSVSVACDQRGPASADIVLPRNSAHLSVASIMPGGIGAYVEIDATRAVS